MLIISSFYENLIYKFYDKRSLISDIPQDILSNIFRYLNYSDLQSLGCMSKNWNIVTNETISIEQSVLMTSFAKCFNIPLGDLKFSTLLNTKTTSLECLDLFINTLKHLDSINLNELELSAKKWSRPRFFDELFNLVRIYKHFKTTIYREEKFRLHYLALELFKKRYIDQSFQVCNGKIYSLADCDNRDYTLFILSKKFTERGQFLKAYGTICMISEKSMKNTADTALISVCESFRYSFNHKAKMTLAKYV